MPSLTPADALIQAADNLTTALAGDIPPPSMTTDARRHCTTHQHLQDASRNRDGQGNTSKGAPGECTN
jgi:hypothetical protein